jgi:septin family protein
MEEIKKKLEKMEPLPGLGIKTYNILLVGVIGSGKSSFYNTLATVFMSAVKSHAPARDAPTSVTNEVRYFLKLNVFPFSKQPMDLLYKQNLREIFIKSFHLLTWKYTFSDSLD